MNYVTGPYTAMVRGQSTGLAGCVSPDCQAKPYCLRADPALRLKAPETAGMSAPGCRLYIPNNQAPAAGSAP